MASQRPRTNRSSSGARPRPGSDRSRNEKPQVAQKALPALDPDNGFLALGVPDTLCGALALEGITDPFPIQVSTLPDSLQGRDVLGRGRTGSGTTLAFGLAVLTRLSMLQLDRQPFRPRALILAPTRELALQIDATISPLARRLGLRTTTIFGGVGQNPQVDALRKGVDVVVACPGRLEDLIKRRDLDLGAVALAVIDEADRMADMGFMPAVKRIMRAVSKNRQTLLFSATLDGDVDALIKEFQNSPKKHQIAAAENAGEIDHLFWNVGREDRTRMVAEIATHYERAIVFCRTKHGSDRLAKNLDSMGMSTCVIHGNRSQAQREKALEQFRRGKATVMVATDVAARGIHIDAVPVVIHFDLPEDPKDYIHRSGRTGRAGQKGVVISLIDKSMRRSTGQLTKGMKFEVNYVDPDFEAISLPTKPIRPGEIGTVKALSLQRA
jgi:superfamily II DNA/RNA helicase